MSFKKEKFITQSYYCTVCGRTHHLNSKIGQDHLTLTEEDPLCPKCGIPIINRIHCISCGYFIDNRVRERKT